MCVFFKIDSVETDMILCGSLPNHENRMYTMEPLLKDSFAGTAGRGFFGIVLVT